MKTNAVLLFVLVAFLNYFPAQVKYTKIAAYNAENGLSSDHAYDTAQDSKGFIWTATNNGVNRFDGHGFQRFTIENGLPSNEVLQVFTDRTGRLWVNCYMKPLAYFDEKLNRFVVYQKDQLFSNNLWTYKLNYRNNYQAIYKGNLIEIDSIPRIRKNISGFPLMQKNAYIKSSKFQNNRINIDILQNSKIITKSAPAKFALSYSFPYLQSIFALSTDNEIRKYSLIGDSFELKEEIIPLKKKIQHFSFSGPIINVIFQDGSVSMIDGDSFRIVNTIKSEANPNNAFIDRNGNIWLSTVDEGVQLFRNVPLRTFNFGSSKATKVQSIKVHNDKIYSASYAGQIYENERPLIDLRTLATGKKNNRVNDLIFTSNHSILISDHFIIKDLRKVIIPPRLMISAIKSSQRHSDTLIILGTSNGLFGYNPMSDKIQQMSPYEQRILNLTIASGNTLLFTNSDQVFKTRLKSKKIDILPISSYFQDDFISGMQSVAPDLLWISTYSGNLYLFKNLQYFASLNYRNGISNNIRSIMATPETVWIGTHSDGLIRMDYTLKNKKLDYRLSFVNTMHGLASNTINSIDFKSDSVVVGTNNGISVLAKNFVSKDRKTVPVIVQSRIDGEKTANSNSYFLKKNQHNISLTISNVDFDNNYTRIQYAVDEPKDWINLKENVLNLEVSSGKKIIFIRSLKRNMSEASEIIKIRIEKEKHFYESYWFWLITGGAVIGLLVFMRSRKAMQKQKSFYEKELDRQKLLQRERERISTDMHDDLGASITALRYQAEFLKRKIGESPLQNDVDDLLNTSQEIHKSMREMLWNLKSENDNLGNFTDYIEKYTKAFFLKSPIAVLVEQKNIDKNLQISSEARRNMFLCTKEALNNVLKHSEAKNIHVKMIQENQKFQVQITDDGIGIPEDHKKGNGLRNMEFRMNSINGNFIIQNSLKGTRLICEMPV